MSEPVLCPVPLVCKCGYEWHAKLIYNVAVNVWIAHVKSLRCPNCGANYRRIAFRTVGAAI